MSIAVNFAEKKIMKSPAILSVSKKFYADILTRVSVALSFSPSSVEEAMRIINAYLSGRLVGTDNQSAMIAFNMIKPEIDRAMLRSQRARERAKSRREMKTQNETTAPVEKAEQRAEPVSSLPQVVAEPSGVRLSRRERRAAGRNSTSGKMKWRSLV